MGFLDGSVVKNSPANAGDMHSIPGSGRSTGERNGNPLQYSCLGNLIETCSLSKHGGYNPQGHKESDTTEQLNTTKTE